jgi:hypothetical protein
MAERPVDPESRELYDAVRGGDKKSHLGNEAIGALERLSSEENLSGGCQIFETLRSTEVGARSRNAKVGTVASQGFW